jgi:hypothetical protein
MNWNQKTDDVAVSTSVVLLDSFDIQQGARKLHINVGNTGAAALNSFRIDVLPQDKSYWFPIASDDSSFTSDMEYPLELMQTITSASVTSLASDDTAWIDMDILGMTKARLYASSVSDTTVNIRWQTR